MPTAVGYQVWAMALVSGVAVWNSANWQVQTRVLPQESNLCPGLDGPAAFRLLRALRAESHTAGYAVDSWFPTKGQYVAITDLTSSGPGISGITYWAGVFDDYEVEALKNQYDYIGSVTGTGLGEVLDQVPVANLHMEDLSGGVAAGIALQSPPTFNMEGLIQGEVIGNMVTGADGNPQFAASPGHCGTLWDRWSMLLHVLAYCSTTSAKIPAITLSAYATNVQTLLQAAVPEVIRTEGLTLKGILDLLIGPARGLFWGMTITSSGWQINVYSGTDGAIGAIPAAVLVDAVLDGTDARVTLHNSQYDNYDAVQIEGAPCIFSGTVFYPSYGAGWSAAQEADYKTAAKGVIAAATWNPMPWDMKQALNRQYRQAGSLADVYVRYILSQDANGQFTCKGGAGYSITTQFLCPEITWNGTTAAVNNSVAHTPYPPEARLHRTLPWPQGVKADGTDNRTTEMKARPKYLEPVVIVYEHQSVYNSSDSNPILWTDLLHPVWTNWSATPSVSIDDRGPALRIKYAYPEMLGYGSFTAQDTDEYDPNTTVYEGHANPATNGLNLFLTLAIPSDQRVRVINYKSGYSSTTFRNILKVNRPDLNCWVMRAHTFLGLTVPTSGSSIVPDETTTDSFVRNDWPVAQKLCDELSAYAFRQRIGATIVLAGINVLPSWLQLGFMIGNLIEQNGNTTSLHTIISNVKIVYAGNSPRVVVTTSDPPMPDSYALVPQVPASGGTISTAMGAAHADTTQHVRALVKDVQKAVTAIPVTSQPETPEPRPMYGFVQWNCTTAVVADASQAELCKFDGTRVTTAMVVYIDAATSVVPTTFGNVWYRLEFIGFTTRSGVTKRTYRAITPLGNSDGLASGGVAASLVIDVAGQAYGHLIDVSGTNLTTTIAGTAKNNVVGIVGNFSVSTVGQSVDVLRPFASRPKPAAISATPAWTQTNMRTGAGTSVDKGEYFRIFYDVGIMFTAAGGTKFEKVYAHGSAVLFNYDGSSVKRDQESGGGFVYDGTTTPISSGAWETDFNSPVSAGGNLFPLKDSTGSTVGQVTFTFTGGGSDERMVLGAPTVASLSANWSLLFLRYRLEGGRSSNWSNE